MENAEAQAAASPETVAEVMAGDIVKDPTVCNGEGDAVSAAERDAPDDPGDHAIAQWPPEGQEQEVNPSMKLFSNTL